MNEWRVSEALVSFRRLREILPQMTEEEIIRAIALEEETRRRQSVLKLLYRQARRLSRNKLHQAINQEK